ncbi:hypothetical protein DX933_05455 [Ornithinibacillus gellani]|uniref:hypothetical protein n=1 Tax=Ornithinibacillus gellani TaxID=2293253 RepID=UPI000F4848C5|nr:hypothetical protein [Ornithinibacillus gellani]TQS75720.1 hypothetical protein DX933_05455 [Ornithinibacillus gellani]
MSELNDFLYELNRYAQQAHILKDCYEKLTESEKKLVMDQAPAQQLPPDTFFHQSIDWVEAMHEILGTDDKHP